MSNQVEVVPRLRALAPDLSLDEVIALEERIHLKIRTLSRSLASMIL